jgi:putative DNA primase/helicase
MTDVCAARTAITSVTAAEASTRGREFAHGNDSRIPAFTLEVKHMSTQFEAHVQDLKARAHGHWTPVLEALGVDRTILNGKNQPCPLCGGTDRFQYTDKFGEGNYHCRACGAGGGLKLARGILGCRFGELLERVEALVGTARPAAPVVAGDASPEKMRQLCERLWGEARPIKDGDDVDRYLRNRGLHLQSYPNALRCHPALGFYDKRCGQRPVKVAEYPAMLARVQAPDGSTVTLHRTYLKNGAKAAGAQSKKALSPGINEAAVRLFEATQSLAITEGIETALAVHLRTELPVWAALNCGNLEKVWIPDAVRQVAIYGDNDADRGFDGQAAAYALARRLRRQGKRESAAGPREISVYIPRRQGADWANVWVFRLENGRQAA